MNKFKSFPKSALGRTVIAGVILSSVIIATHSSAHVEAPAANQPAAALTITAAQATLNQWPEVIEASGAIAPWQEAVIGAQVAGLRLTDIFVNVGDRVHRGQVLAVFDANLLQADEARLKAGWQQAEANRQRALQLKGSGGISDQDVLQYETQADVAKAQLQSTQLQLRYATVVAPDDGVISARSATIGAVSTTGQELFHMIRQNRLEWRGELTAAQLTKIQTGQNIALSLPDGSAASAKVRQLAPGLDTQTRLGIVYADIVAGSSARAGMYANGKVVLAQTAAITVPSASVVIRDGHSYVPRLQEGNRISMQAVMVGRRVGDATEIISGLSAGNSVAVQGAGFLNDGDVVRLASTSETNNKQ